MKANIDCKVKKVKKDLSNFWLNPEERYETSVIFEEKNKNKKPWMWELEIPVLVLTSKGRVVPCKLDSGGRFLLDAYTEDGYAYHWKGEDIIKWMPFPSAPPKM